MSKIKICGLTRQNDISIVNDSMPDYIGFVFAKSKRFVSQDTARALKLKLNKNIKSVGVFVNEKISTVIKACNENIVDIIQLHGDEDNGYIDSLRQHTDKEIIKAVRVKGESEIIGAADYKSDYILFDTYTENEYGGTGKTFDWSMIKNFDRPFFLSGGLCSENIVSAFSACSPYCVDISSGVESYGVKDISKVNDVMRLVRRGH